MERRKGLLVDRTFQLQVILAANIFAIFIIFGFFLIAHRFESSMLDEVQRLPLAAQDPMISFLDNASRSLMAYCAVSGLFILGFFNIAALLFSHRVAGPLYRMRQHFESMSKGAPVSSVRLRKRDYFHELAAACNAFLKTLQK